MVVGIAHAESKNPYLGLKEVIESVGGLAGIEGKGRVLIKPNMVGGTKSTPWFGSMTNPKVLEALIRYLIEALGINSSKITIGEGSCISLSTKEIFKILRIDKIAQKYQVNLVDFDDGPFQRVQLGDTKVEINSLALQDENYLINLPVLHTHIQVTFSGAVKNLKGFISKSSKREFHKIGLNKLLVELVKLVESDFTIIDATFSMSKGPSPIGGIAHRTNFLLAGPSSLSCDAVACCLLSLDLDNIAYLRDSLKQRELWADKEVWKIKNLEIRGSGIEEIRGRLNTINWGKQRRREDLFLNRGVKGVTLTADETVCSGCIGVNANYHLAPFLLFKNRSYDIEVIFGQMKPQTKASTKILYGDCAILSNSESDGQKIKGCPPPIAEFYPKFCNYLHSPHERLFAKLILPFLLRGWIKGKIPHWKEYKDWW
jgi:uncharacterized protein (DUF362 family)